MRKRKESEIQGGKKKGKKKSRAEFANCSSRK